MSQLAFPDGFLWGAATSAHQIEGSGADSDWAAWESAGNVPSCGRAADSWNRWREDLDVASALGLSVFRISVEWARLEPEPGRFDDAVFAHYAEVLTEAQRRGMKTMLVLWHFTLPLWVAERGGWTWREAPEEFGAFAGEVAARLGTLVDLWATVNEASTHILLGYLRGKWPPGRRHAWLTGWRAYRGLSAAHACAYDAIKQSAGVDAQVGLTHALIWGYPASRGGALAGPYIAFWNWLANDVFLSWAAGRMDWLGVQYYLSAPMRLASVAHDDGSPPRTDLGWRIEPRGLYEVVMRAWNRCRVPLYVTENGLADAEDRQRGRFLLDHLAWLHRAMGEGADVRGYLHWALIDNYEWAHGFEPRFGLAEVDYETCERNIRPSGRLYAEIVRSNALPEGLRPDLTYADGRASLAP